MQPDALLRGFAPGWLLTLFTLSMLPLLLALGCWQLDRAEEKRQLEERMAEARAQAPVPLARLPSLTDQAWRRVYVQGMLDPQRIWLLDNRTRAGVAGVEVIQLFRPGDGGEPLLLNRGWLAWPERSTLPTVQTPGQPVLVEALVLPAVEQGFSLGENRASGWPRLISRVELEVMAEQAGLAASPPLLRLEQPGLASLVLDWPDLPTSASKHTGYAVQWFAMALALSILFFWAGLRPAAGGNKKNAQ